MNSLRPKSAAGGKRLLPLLRQVIRVEISYCAASVIFIVLLIIPEALPVSIECNEIIHSLGIGIHGYLYSKRAYLPVIPQIAATANQIDYWILGAA